MKSSSTSGCVYELQTLEDQLEAALASLTLSISDSPTRPTTTTTTTSRDEQNPHSSDSSACSSGVGDELVNEFVTSRTAIGADDGDSAFSDAESTDKILSSNPNENVKKNQNEEKQNEKFLSIFV